jgi:cytochrome c oxidase accessory protein FixG
MFDRDTMIVTYDAARGEPRGPRSRKIAHGAGALGDCVNCGLCVQVCPTGIDIRDGLQYECIGCAACIDACDQVMGKFHYPSGLIRYSTENALAHGWGFREMVRRVLRTRTLIYGAILFGVMAVLAGALYLRVPLKVDIVRDRASLAREVEGGRIENVYRIQLMNTQEVPHRFRIAASGLPGIRVASESEVEVPAATTRQVPLRVQIDPGATAKGSHRFEVEVKAVDDERIVAREQAVFLVR